MCGIVGILNFDPRASVEEERLRRMRDVLRHRGPDAEGLMISGNVGLGHRRLSIIDLAGGRQPMCNRARSVWLTFNGEIYNFKALRADLEAGGCVFGTNSDTEVLLRAYEVWGEACVERLRGMFAFAIWDEQRQTLFLARDRLGIKPLYYAVSDDGILFASEIKGILAGGARPSFNTDILPEYLATRFSAGPRTFYRGIMKLLPGHTLSWSRVDGLRINQYWQLPDEIDGAPSSFDRCAREVRALLDDAVQSHLMSDVPLGVFLSGGIDSTGLAALMASKVKEPIRTFSVGFDDPAFNELPYARMAADSIGAIHREVVLMASEFFDALPKLIWHEDEPIAFPSSVPLYFVSQLARETVKVVMTGEGADELFLGYNRYRVTAWNERIGRAYWGTVPNPMRAGIRALLHRLPPAWRRYPERSFLALSPDPRGLFYENFAVFPARLREQLLGEQASDPYAESLRYYQQGPTGTLERMGHADLQTYLVELLMKQDQMSMAASIESRVPFLDHVLVERVAAMPARYKIQGWQTKAVLRAALKDLVPKPIMTRKKMGFPVPLSQWFRGRFWPLVEEFVLSERALKRGLFRPEALRRIALEHRAGRAQHGDRLWLLVNL
ncbi:MAG TPA: asparagine synthase (glutamine-hydrolyzing), partial [Burkholderiales bacterium]|nr:asparagine synthase (glutamine-hydrolyzing) [Burkholderiales bacterium]